MDFARKRPVLLQQVRSLEFSYARNTYLLIKGRKKRKLLNSPACQVEATVLRNALTRFRSSLNYRYWCELLKGPNIWLCPKCVKILSKRNSMSEELARIDGEINAKCEALIVHGVHSGNITSPMATSESTSSISVSSASAAPVLSVPPEPSSSVSVLSTSASPVSPIPSVSIKSPDVSVSNHDIYNNHIMCMH